MDKVHIDWPSEKNKKGMLGGLSLVQAVQCCTVIGCLEIMENCQRFSRSMKIYTMYIDMKKVKNLKQENSF